MRIVDFEIALMGKLGKSGGNGRPVFPRPIVPPDRKKFGIALSFVNYTQELPYFCDQVLPVLKQAGYRG